MSQSPDRTHLTPNEVAALFSVSPVTVRQWSQKGLLEAETTAGGHRRYRRDALIRFAASRGMRSPFSEQDRLLIVDDNRQFNDFLKVLFETECEGVEIASAYDGFEAGAEVQRFKPTVVLLDIMMPGLDGIAVCTRLKTDPLSAATRVIGMTGHFSDELAQRMVAAGAETLLKKPFDAEQVLTLSGFRRHGTTTARAH